MHDLNIKILTFQFGNLVFPYSFGEGIITLEFSNYILEFSAY